METRSFTFDHKLSDAIVLSPHLNRKNVRVRSEGNSVRISGSVGSFFEKQMAQETLRQIEGIDQIQNDLQVESN